MSNRIISSIACADNKVLFQDFKGTLYCVSAVNGLLLWYWKPPVLNSNPFYKTDLIVKGNVIYLIDAGGNFRCIDALLGTEKWSIKNIYASGLIKTNNNELLLSTNKNKILIVSTKLGKITNEIVLASETKNEKITDFILIKDKIVAGFSDSSVYEIKKKQKAKFKFLSSLAPVVSLVNVDENCLITDYDGNLTLLKISNSK
jgi:outer membrane protein assembly factor BamB